MSALVGSIGSGMELKLGLRWQMVGRERELDAFECLWSDPACRVVLISGPDGVGKSRLAEAFLARTGQLGFRGGRATATAVASDVPFGAIAHVLPPGMNPSAPMT